MPVEPTRYSRISVGFSNSAQSLPDKFHGDTGAVFSVMGPSAFSGGTMTVTGAQAMSSTFSVGGAATFQSTVTTRGTATAGTLLVQSAATFNSTLSANGAATFLSTLTVSGQVNADAGVQVGGGVVAQVISSGTAAISLGAIAPLESSSAVTFAVSGLSRLDMLMIAVDSIYPVVAANRDISWMCSSSSTVGEANVWGVNSTLTSVTPTASTVIRWTRIKFGNYPAA